MYPRSADSFAKARQFDAIVRASPVLSAGAHETVFAAQNWHPDGELGPIVSRALDLLIADLQRTRLGVGARRKVRRHPVKATESGGSVSRATWRAVLERDGLACTWVDDRGKRCGSRARLELDHRHPRGKGGGSETDNIPILCRAHNQLAAEQAFGREHMARAKRHASRCRQTRPSPRGADPANQ